MGLNVYAYDHMQETHVDTDHMQTHVIPQISHGNLLGLHTLHHEMFQNHIESMVFTCEMYVLLLYLLSDSPIVIFPSEVVTSVIHIIQNTTAKV